MIQRVQSILLFISAISSCILAFTTLGTFANADGGFVYNAFVIKDITPDPQIVMTTYYIGILLIMSAILSLVIIFLYKDRMKQIRWNYFNMLLFLVSIALMLFIYPDFIIAKKIGISKNSIDFNWLIIIYMIVDAAAIYFANIFIKKDEKKIRAADRLR